MYHGKYSSPKPVRRARRKNSPSLLLISLVLLLFIAVGGSVAYLLDITGRVENTFTPAQVEIDPTEETTADSKSNIKFQNSGSVPVYIRATLVIYWEEKTVNNETQVIAQPAGGSVAVGDLLNNGWFQVGDIYYYKSPVDPGDWTEVMLGEIKVTVPEGSDAKCRIDVRAEAIQAEPADAVKDAWTDVVVSGVKLEPAASAAG